MYYMCRISPSRIGIAAASGLVPGILRVLREQSPLKQFALPLLCDLRIAHPKAWDRLWAEGGPEVFIELLSDQYWQRFALATLQQWCVGVAVTCGWWLCVEPLS